jgi:hypothetical protein
MFVRAAYRDISISGYRPLVNESGGKHYVSPRARRA